MVVEFQNELIIFKAVLDPMSEITIVHTHYFEICRHSKTVLAGFRSANSSVQYWASIPRRNNDRFSPRRSNWLKNILTQGSEVFNFLRTWIVVDASAAGSLALSEFVKIEVACQFHFFALSLNSTSMLTKLLPCIPCSEYSTYLNLLKKPFSFRRSLKDFIKVLSV